MNFPMRDYIEKFVECTKKASTVNYKDFIIEETLYLMDLGHYLKLLKDPEINQKLADMANCILSPAYRMEEIKELLYKECQSIYDTLKGKELDWESASS